MIRLLIPYPPTKKGKSDFCRRYGLNAYYVGKHWAERKKDAETLHTLTRASFRGSGIRKAPVNYPVEVRFFWDDGLDVDNHAVLGKSILDAMKGYVIQDDSRRFVRKVSHEFWDGGAILVEIVSWGGIRTKLKNSEEGFDR